MILHHGTFIMLIFITQLLLFISKIGAVNTMLVIRCQVGRRYLTHQVSFIVPPITTATKTNRYLHHGKRSYNLNRYERFRQCLRVVSSSDTASTTTTQHHSSFDINLQNITNLINVGKHGVEVISPNRRSFNRTWKRMKPMLDIILDSCYGHNDNDDDDVNMQLDRRRRLVSIADVGCDHGMLALSLACMAWVSSPQIQQQRVQKQANKYVDKENQRDNNIMIHESNTPDEEIPFFFTKVIGTDISKAALSNGGLVSLQKINDAMAIIRSDDGKIQLPIDFRVGNGLESLQPGEADAIILAGMGVITMLDILSDVDRVNTQRIFVQPTNSRPQHMMILYENIQSYSEWVLRNETVAYLSGRWYINAYFERQRQSNNARDTSFRYPGQFLVQQSKEGDDEGVYDAYVKHHLRWLKPLYEKTECALEAEDIRWLEYIQSADENHKWKEEVTWFSK